MVVFSFYFKPSQTTHRKSFICSGQVWFSTFALASWGEDQPNVLQLLGEKPGQKRFDTLCNCFCLNKRTSPYVHMSIISIRLNKGMPTGLEQSCSSAERVFTPAIFSTPPWYFQIPSLPSPLFIPDVPGQLTHWPATSRICWDSYYLLKGVELLAEEKP